MDWQKLTQTVTFAQTLEPSELEDYLQNLTEDTLEVSDEIREIVSKVSQADAFMMTAVGDYLPSEQPLYKTGDIIGHWQIDSLIGSGGMGNV